MSSGFKTTETVMRTVRTALLTSAAAILCAGYAALAEAKSVETMSSASACLAARSSRSVTSGMCRPP
jgi:hypothetical protein